MSGTFSCACDGPATAPPVNPPGLGAIAYRDATFASLRRALLTPVATETQLTAWRPGASGDLAVMIAEWWAYLGDILTFYNERIANEDYLATATQPASLSGLISLLGYRPNPGIGANATLAALVQPGPTSGNTITLPTGLQVRSKPAPGQTPQIFEVSQPTAISAPDSVPAIPPRLLLSPNGGLLLLAGSVSSILAGASLLLRPRDGSAPAWVQVSSSTVVTLPSGAKQTQLAVTVTGAATGGAIAYRLEQTTQTAAVWSLGGSAVDSSGNLHLAGLVRGLVIGDQVVLSYTTVRTFFFGGKVETSRSNAQMIATITAIQDVIWDGTGNPPAAPNPANPLTALIIPHTQISIQGGFSSETGGAVFDHAIIVYNTMFYNWTEAARLVDQPVTTWPNAASTLVPAGATPFPPTTSPASVLIVDATGVGVTASASTRTDGSLSVTGLGDPPPVLQAPLAVMFNPLQVTRGQTVTNEVLGTGDPTVANQVFSLAKSPLTYLRQNGQPVSQLSITVNGQTWTEVASFYNQPADAMVFVTAQDTLGNTQVLFGDGVNAARPIGAIVANYRFGSGAAVPPAGSLTVIARPFPGLRALSNPLEAGGGADPDPADQIRAYAPRSVLTFGRAVSGPDFEAIAATIANGNRVRATWAWNGASQRGVVTIHVDGDATTISDVQQALLDEGDPNRPVSVVVAPPLVVQVAMTLLITATADAPTIQNAVITALTDPAQGLFGAQNLGIDQPVFDSAIAAACQNVAGVVAVIGLSFTRADGVIDDPLHIPPPGQFFSLAAADVSAGTQVIPSGQ